MTCSNVEHPSNNPNIRPSIAKALDQLFAARKGWTSLFPKYNALEKEFGLGSDESKKFSEEFLDPAMNEVDVEQCNLVNTPARTAYDLVAKLHGLIDGELNVDTDAAKKLKSEAEAILSVEDPTIELYAEWRRLWNIYRLRIRDCPTGNWDTPETEWIESLLDEKSAFLEKMVPTTPAGVFALIEYRRLSCERDTLPGTEAWEAEYLNNPEAVLARNIYDGAAIVAKGL